MDIKRIIKEYYAHKFDNLDGMNQLLERHNLPKLVQEEIGNLSRPISIKEIESLINSLLKQKAPHPDGFTAKFYQIFMDELYHLSTVSFRRCKQKEYFLTHSNYPNTKTRQRHCKKTTDQYLSRT